MIFVCFQQGKDLSMSKEGFYYKKINKNNKLTVNQNPNKEVNLMKQRSKENKK